MWTGVDYVGLDTVGGCYFGSSYLLFVFVGFPFFPRVLV